MFQYSLALKTKMMYTKNKNIENTQFLIQSQTHKTVIRSFWRRKPLIYTTRLPLKEDDSDSEFWKKKPLLKNIIKTFQKNTQGVGG